MSKKTATFIATEKELETMGSAYPGIHSRMPKELDERAHAQVHTRLAKANSDVRAKEAALLEARAHRLDAARAARTFMKRVRKVVGGSIGQDSVEYAMVGGTRDSLRKPPTRKPKGLVPVLVPPSASDIKKVA